MGCWSALCGCLSKSCFVTESRDPPAVEGHNSGGAPARPPVPIPSPIVDGPRPEPLAAGPALAPAQLSQQRLPVDPAPAGIISIVGMRDQVHAAQPRPLHIRKGQEQATSGTGGLAIPNFTAQSLNAATPSGSPAFPVPAATETLTSIGPPPQLSSPQSSKAASSSTEAPRLLTGSSPWGMQHCTPLQLPTSSEKEIAPFAFNMPRPNMADAAALAVATVARVSPMPNRSFTSRRGPAGAFACSLAGLPHHRSPSIPAGMPHQATYKALAALPADLPAQALLDDSRTVSISSSDEIDDGLPSPTGATAAAAIEALQVGGRPHYAALGHGVPPSERDLQRQNAEEAAFIRGTLAALKQATLAGFEDFGEVEVLPGLPRVRSSHSSYGRGQAVSVTSATTNIGLSQSSAASGGPASRQCLKLNAVVHGANLAAIFCGGGGAASASAASASASAMLQPLQTSTQTGCGFSGDYLAAKVAAGPASQQTIRAMVDIGEVLGFSYGSPPGIRWENGAHPPPRPTDTRPLHTEEPPTGGCVGGRDDGVPSPTMLVELPKLPPLLPLQSRHPQQPFQRQQCPIAGPPLIPLEQLPPSTSGWPSPPLPGVGLPPPPPQWPQQQAAGHRYAEVLQQIFARATAAQQQLRQQQQQQMQQLYKAHHIPGQPHTASLSAQPQLQVDQPPAQQPQPQRPDEQRRGASTALPAALEPPGALKMAVSAEDAALQFRKPSLPKDSPLPMEMGSGKAGPHECVEVPTMSPLLQEEGAAQEHGLLRNGEEAHINIGWNHADSITCASISDCEGKRSAPKPALASTISFTTQTDANEVSGGIVANRDHPCKATSKHYVGGDDSGRVGGEGAKGAEGSTSSTAASKVSTAEVTLAGDSAKEHSTGACSAGSGSADDGVTGGDTAEGCSIANCTSHGDPVEALLTAVSFSAQTNNGLHITVAPLPPAATAAEAEVTAFARQLPSEQRKELAQLVREKWSPFTFPQLFTAESPMGPPVATAAAAEVLRGSSRRVLDALPAMVDAVRGDAGGIWSSSCGAATSRTAGTSLPPMFSHMPTWKEPTMPQSIGSLSTSGAGSYHRCTGRLRTWGASAAAPPQSTGAKGASQCPPPRVCDDIVEPSKFSCMTAPGHAGLLPSPMRYRSAESSTSSVIRSLNAVAVTSVREAYDSGAGVDGHAGRDAVQQPTTEQSQGARCMVAVESVAMALPQPPVLPPSPQHAAAAAAGGAGLGPQLPQLVPYRNREQQQGYAMTVDSTIVPAAPAGPARAAVTATGVAATASAVETTTPRRLLPPDPVGDLPGATKSPAAAPARCNADMDYVRSLVGRKWSPFFDMEASLRLLKAPSVAAPAALPDNAINMTVHRVLDMQPCHGPAPSIPILTEPYAAHHQPYPPRRAAALRMTIGRQLMDNGSGTVVAMAATATQTAATGAVAAATAAAPSTPAPAADVASEEEAA